MIIKNEKIKIGNPKYSGFPFTFKIHFNREIGEYVLCRGFLFKYDHYSIEEVKDMLSILIKYNKKLKK